MDSSGDQATCRRPVRAVRPAIAAASAGLPTGPVNRTVRLPAVFSRATTSAWIVGQLDAAIAVIAPLPRRTESGARARSGS